jgi:tetratricopeptide (TPR) repeat protein
MNDALQLGLFSWDRIMTGEGFSAMARLDFKEAIVIFEDVLSKWHGHPEASDGLRMSAEWANSVKEVEALKKDDGIETFWRRINSYPFGDRGQALKRSLLERLIGLMEDDFHLLIPPDLCLGRLFFELEDYEKAEYALMRLLERQSPDGRLLVLFGNCLLRLGRITEARTTYAKAFLSWPWDMPLEEIIDKELIEAIAGEDIYSAAVCGWLRGVLPLIEVATEKGRDKDHQWSLLVYRTIRLAEKTRIRGDYKEMVEQRRLLKEYAPAVFLEYMGRM